MKRKGRPPRAPSPPPQPGAAAPQTPAEPSAANVGDPSVHSPASPPADAAFPIVGIGASAGGLAALEAFFSAMPTDRPTDTAFVLVQHLSPDYKSILADLVRRYTRMNVFEVQDGMKVRPDCAYIIPPNRDMALINGTLELLQPTAARGLRTPIDFFFRSMAQDQHERAICIVLSGTGSDGTLGLRAVKGEGGMAMAQSPESAEHDGMPRSAIATGLVDYVLPPAAMPAQLMTYLAHAFGKGQRTATTPTPRTQDALKRICVLLRAQTGHDFSNYKESTVVRRVERRMALHQIERSDDYVRYLQITPDEVGALFRDLLIGVTNFFRDREAFQSLQTRVIPRLFATKSAGDPVRIWVAGCSTGEEAYSIAMLVQEQMDLLKQTFNVQIFATDVDRQAIDHARNGVFPASIAADISPERLARFFIQDPAGIYRVQKSLRDMMIFSEQDLIRDPPFSRLDLISCRNVMIYMNGDLQKKLIQLFHYALTTGGVLFLGTSESVGEFSTLFDTLDRKWKIFIRQRDLPGMVRPSLGGLTMDAPAQRPARRAVSGAEEKATLKELAEKALLEHYVEAGVLVNRHGDVLYIHGRTGRYLEPSPGEAGMNILKMAREGLRRELTTALHRATTSLEIVRYQGVRVKVNGHVATTNLAVAPIAVAAPPAQPDLFLVVFEEVAAAAADAEPKSAVAGRGEPPGELEQRVGLLEAELRSKDEYLQSTLEEMETSNEELKSANEELQSVNEELQSTNEELETSKEELQSVNEELATVNTELQAKVNDLSRANNDMNNLLAGTGVATLFVDLQLRVTRFTPTITQLMNLIPTDVGRPVEQVVPNLVGYNTLGSDMRAVLATLTPRESEVQTQDGTWYLMRLRPYRTLENAIEGGVITFVDITDLKGSEETVQQQLSLLASYESAPVGLALLDTDLRVKRVNNTLAGMFGLAPSACTGRTLKELVPSLALQAANVAAEILDKGQPLANVEFTGDTPAAPGVSRTFVQGWHPLRGAGDRVVGFSVVVQEVTARRSAEADSERTRKGLVAELEAMSRLQALGALFVGEGHLLPVLEQALNAAIAITAADLGTIQLFDPATGRLTIVAQRGFDRPFIEFWNSVAAGGAAYGASIDRGERVIVEDIQQSPIFVGTPAMAVMLQAGVRAVQSTPLMSRTGKLLGVFSTHHRTPHQASQRELRLLDVLGRQTSDIIDLARSGEELRRLAGDGANDGPGAETA